MAEDESVQPAAAAKRWEDFHHKWSGRQSVATILALGLGMLWALYTFWVQRQDREQSMEGKIDLGIDAKQISLPEEPKGFYVVITVTVKNVGTSNITMCFEEPDPDYEKTEKTNCPDSDHAKGNLAFPNKKIAAINVVRMRYDPSEKRVSFNNKDTQILVTQFRNDIQEEEDTTLVLHKGLNEERGMSIRAGQTVQRTAVVRLPEPGLYRIAFSARQPKQDAKLALALKPTWGTSMYFVVSTQEPHIEKDAAGCVKTDNRPQCSNH